MLVWKKVWTWTKHHWYIPVILILILACILAGKGVKNKYFDIMMQSRENYKKEVEIIKKNNAEEKEKTLNALRRYQESLAKIEEDFSVKMEELPKKEKKEVEAAIEKFDNDPDKLAEEIANILGAQNV
mgnify:CR=1 FL=1|tara:strand:- start:585 stop:968 length:384 start_codon:yes stop_codon:yes gene_type:complete